MVQKTEARRPIAVDLFAGAGGLSLGFEQAGFDVLASVEIDPIHCATHKFNFPFWSILCKSVVETTGEEIRDSSTIGDLEIDVVFGGPPCQGFSVIGKRVLEDPRNSLVLHFVRIVLELKPKFFVMENVPGMVLGQSKELLVEVIELFKANGYSVEENYCTLNAACYGVPQNRERLFILGCRQGLQLPKYPLQTTKPAKSNNIFEWKIPQGPTVWEAIRDLPDVEQYPELYEQDWTVAEFNKPSDYSRQLRGLCSVEDDYSYQRWHNPRILTSSLRTKHTSESVSRFAATPHGKIEPISRFHKLDPEGICNTLRAGTARNRGSFTSARPIHPFIPRCITVREAARLHSYPDWFRFHATKWHGFRQIGNSVPPSLGKSVASEIIKALEVRVDKPREIQELGDERLLRFHMSQAAKQYGVNPHVIEPRNRNLGPKGIQ